MSTLHWTSVLRTDSWELLYDLHDLGIPTQVPVPIVQIVRHLGVNLHFVDSDPGWSCAVRFDHEKADIWVRGNTPRVFQRYDVAFGLGRILWCPQGEYRDWRPTTGAVTESPKLKRVQRFADGILLPRTKLTPIVYDTTMPFQSIAEYFTVPQNVLARRLDRLRKGYYPE